MTRITIEGEAMTLGRIQELTNIFNDFFSDDLHMLPDSFTGNIIIASDKHLHIKRELSITKEPEVLEALELARITKEAKCNTIWDSMEIREV